MRAALAEIQICIVAFVTFYNFVPLNKGFRLNRGDREVSRPSEKTKTSIIRIDRLSASGISAVWHDRCIPLVLTSENSAYIKDSKALSRSEIVV